MRCNFNGTLQKKRSSYTWIRQESCARENFFQDSSRECVDKATKLLLRVLPAATFSAQCQMNNVIPKEAWTRYLESQDFSRKNNSATFHYEGGQPGRKRVHAQCA